MFMFLLDLDELPELSKKSAFLSHNRFNIYSFRDSDHLHMGKESIRENVEAYLQEQGIFEKPAKIRLLTNLRVLGYVFNPVSFYFCEDAHGEPLCILAEVHNTYGELKPYLLDRTEWKGSEFAGERIKNFYISPFSPLEPLLQLKLRMPTEHLALYINSRHPGEAKPFFRSSLTGSRSELTTGQLLKFSLRFPWVTLRVITQIHWHALRLYLKKVPWFGKNANPDKQTGIYPKKWDPQCTSSSDR
jgi:DUF1365 family protein